MDALQAKLDRKSETDRVSLSKFFAKRSPLSPRIKLSSVENAAFAAEVILRNLAINEARLVREQPDIKGFTVSFLRAFLEQFRAPASPARQAKIIVMLHTSKANVKSIAGLQSALAAHFGLEITDAPDWAQKLLESESYWGVLQHAQVRDVLRRALSKIVGTRADGYSFKKPAIVFVKTKTQTRGFAGAGTVFINRPNFEEWRSELSTNFAEISDELMAVVTDLELFEILIHEYAHTCLRDLVDDLNASSPEHVAAQLRLPFASTPLDELCARAREVVDTVPELGRAVEEELWGKDNCPKFWAEASDAVYDSELAQSLKDLRDAIFSGRQIPRPKFSEVKEFSLDSLMALDEDMPRTEHE